MNQKSEERTNERTTTTKINFILYSFPHRITFLVYNLFTLSLFGQSTSNTALYTQYLHQQQQQQHETKYELYDVERV